MTSFNSVKEADAVAEVLVVGAGPVGLALACDLARRGVRARVVEQGDGLFPGSRGKGLQPRTLELLDDLGLGEALQRETGPYPWMLPWKDGLPGEPFALAEPAEPDPGEPYTDSRMLPQWRTQELLYEHLQDLGGGVEFGTRVTGLVQDGRGVTVHLAGTGGVGTSARAQYVVGADGGRSTVRAALDIHMTGEAVEEKPGLVADVRLAGLDRGHWHVWPHAEGGFLALCPLHGTDLFQLAAQFTDDDAEPGTWPDEIRALVADRSHLSPQDVLEVRWASVFRPNTALADRFRAGRVFLAGDAAHVHPPAGGQGLNTGVQDAFNLGWKLGQVLLHGAGDELLDSYEAERLPIAAEVLGLSTRIHRGEQQRGRETRQLHIGYRESPVVHELRAAPDGELRAGDRAPDALVTASAVTGGTQRPGDIRLFDAFRGPRWTLLAFGGAELPHAVPDHVDAYRIQSAEPHAEKAYGSGLFLVRPDGYIGVAADTWSETAAALPGAGLH